MDIRCQIASVFLLDKCLGCHACDLACKEIWTSGEGQQLFWWNHVETRPGSGYPPGWEDQERFRGGWEKKDRGLRLAGTSRWRTFAEIFHNPSQPGVEDYYEPYRLDWSGWVDHPETPFPPSLEAVSALSGEPGDPSGGPSWDDDLAGNAECATLGVGRAAPLEYAFYLPRICNHCLNPACVAACPSGAAYKRAEDGIVLIDQQRCRAWRSCLGACPYKKVYYDYEEGKSGKCHLCYPMTEVGECPSCFRACPGQLRHQGYLLFDAERIPEVAELDEPELVDGFRSLILDPRESAVADGARRQGISDALLRAAMESPVFNFVVRWRLAFPLHPEWRTFPTVFYVPPRIPVRQEQEAGLGDSRWETDFSGYLSRTFSGGNTGLIRVALAKLEAVENFVRCSRRNSDHPEEAIQLLEQANSNPREAMEIYHALACTTLEERIRLNLHEAASPKQPGADDGSSNSGDLPTAKAPRGGGPDR